MNKLHILYFVFVGIIFFACSHKSIPTNVISIDKQSGSTESDLEFQYTFTEANKQLLFGNIKQAALLFTKCAELDSSRSMPYYQLANIYYQAGDSKTALDYAKKAYSKENDNVWVNRLLIDLYRVNNEFDNAISTTEKTILLDPKSIEFQYTLASLYHESERPKKALEVLDIIEKKFGISEEVSISKHQIYAELGRNKEAEEILLNLLQLNPGEYRFKGMLAEFYSSIGKNDEAEKIYSSLIKENISNPLIILSAAEHYRSIKNHDQAKFLYSKVLLNSSFDINSKIRTIIGLISSPDFRTEYSAYVGSIIDSMILQEGEDIKLLTLRADYSIRTNQLDKAETDLARILEKDPSNIVFWEQFLYINNRQNDNTTLLEYSEKALNYFPDQANFYLLKGLAEMNLSKYEASVSSLKKGLKLVTENDPIEIQILTFLGDVYRNMGNDKKSDEYFEMVLKKDPNNMIVLNNYSYYLSLRDEKLDMAEKFSRRTIENDPNNSTYLDTYAWILYKLSQYNDAKKYIEKAIENNGSSNSEILDHYADILVKLKDFENAVKYWKRAIEYGGNESVIQKKIDTYLNLVNEE